MRIYFADAYGYGALDGASIEGERDAANILAQGLNSIASGLVQERIGRQNLDVEGYEGKTIVGGWGTIQRYPPAMRLKLNSQHLNARHRTYVQEFWDFNFSACLQNSVGKIK